MTTTDIFILIFGLPVAVGFILFLVRLEENATDKSFKRSYQEIGQKNPKLQAYLNQGYDLLAIVRDKGLIGTNFSVFNYPAKQDVNKLALFKITFEHFGTSTSQLHTKECAEQLSTEGYTQWLPFEATDKYNYGITIEVNRGIPAQLLSVIFSKKQSPFLTVLFPKYNTWEIFKEPITGTITGTAIPEGQTWQWQSNNASKEDDKLVDITNNNRVLLAMFPPTDFIPSAITYLVIHPEMPKHLVPAFADLSLLVFENRKSR
jgi:hypothetical protein